MDLRNQRTKKNIRNAFIELRSKKPLEKITVKELSELAFINKATFYRHYEDIYALSNELIAYEDEVWFPEDFLNATGKLLVTDPTGQIIRTVELEGEDTGKDGVFGSDTGKYLATAAISKDADDWNGGWRVRIYDAETGKTVWEQNVGTDVSAYQGLSCSVRILDGPRECIVICGRGQNTVTAAYFF